MLGMWAWFTGLLRNIDGIRVSIPTDICVGPYLSSMANDVPKADGGE
jgi:hypothetical protein